MRNNGVTSAVANSKGDSSRCGQIINGEGYGGFSSYSFGTLTAGRQNSLMQERIGGYDPQSLSYAFSALGYANALSGGTGNAETAIWDDSVKYTFQRGLFRAAAMYAQGGRETGMLGQAYGLDGGLAWTSPRNAGMDVGFALDGIFQSGKGLIAASSMTAAQCAGIGLTQPACAGTKVLDGDISDTQTWAVMGKLFFDFGGGYAPPKGVVEKAPVMVPDRLTFYGGYQQVTFHNPSNNYDGPGFGGSPSGLPTLGGYVLGAVNLSDFDTAKIDSIYWAGASYETGGWRLAAAYYGEHQNSWLTGAVATACTGLGTSAVSHNCAGQVQTVSGSVDYAFNKWVDVYAGVAYSRADGGFISGFSGTGTSENTTTGATGVRLRF
jgi:predicted porin